jgi:hypothetical protein
MASTLNATTSSGIVATADNTGSLALQTTGTTAVTIDTSQNVGIGVTTPADRLQVNGSSNTSSAIRLTNQNTNVGYISNYASFIGSGSSNDFTLAAIGAINMIYATNGAERMRIDSSGNVLVNTTTAGTTNTQGWGFNINSNACYLSIGHITGTGNGNPYVNFNYNGTSIGGIVQTTTSSVSYNTTSDYRLKENVAPLTGALDKVAQLKPVTYKWKLGGENGQGFIAHELQAVVPDCVTGEKDAVDAEGKPVYQGIDTSFLVATLTAAIQELKAELDELKAKVGK